MSERVELRPAFVWDCPECGREHFARAVVPEMSPEREAEMRNEYGIESWVEGDFLLAPDRVTCPHCEIEFETKDWHDDEND